MKKIIALLLVLVMCLGLFAACGPAYDVEAAGEFLYNSYTPHGHDLMASEEYYDKEYIENILVNYPIDDYTFYCYLTDTDMN